MPAGALRANERSCDLLSSLIDKRGRRVVWIAGIERLSRRMDAFSWTRFGLGLKLVSLPCVRPRRRVVIRIIGHDLLKNELRSAESAEVNVAGIYFPAILAGGHKAMAYMIKYA